MQRNYNIRPFEFVVTDSKLDLQNFFIYEKNKISESDPKEYLDTVSDSLIKKIVELKDNKNSITSYQEKELQFMLDAFIAVKKNLGES